MRYYGVALAAVLAATLAVPAQAAEAGKVERKTVVVTAGGDEDVLSQGGEGGKVVTITEDGKRKVIKIKGGQLLDGCAELDTASRLKLMDAKIAHLKATGQLKTDIAVKRVEVQKLELAGKSDDEIIAKKKEINSLKARLEDAKLDYEQTVRKLVPVGGYDLYLSGLGDETDLLELDLSLPAGLEKRILKRIELRDDAEESD